MLLIGCKTDLLEDRQVSQESAIRFAGENELAYMEVSAMSGINIEEAFMYLIYEAHLREFSRKQTNKN